MKQLEIYQATRRQNGLPQIDLKIENVEATLGPVVMAERSAREELGKNLLTGE